MSDEIDFVSIGELLDSGWTVPEVATAIETAGVYVWDKFSRLKIADESVRERVLDGLSKWHMHDRCSELFPTDAERDPYTALEDRHNRLIGGTAVDCSGWPRASVPNTRGAITLNSDSLAHADLTAPTPEAAAISAPPALASTAPAASCGNPEPWITRSLEYAADIWTRELENNKRPSKAAVAREIAARLYRDDKMVTKKGKRIDAPYIERAALRAWTPPKPE